MKVGDKLYCIKDYYTISNSVTFGVKSKVFFKNHYYVISNITDNYISIKNHFDRNIGFNLRDINYNYYPMYLEEHFITKKQLRKQKLDKLNFI